ncbi:MAG: DEAD/DEAH box helicase, partial [Polyangiaceae bacterium]|nr:DEAD/DEAH box helicase [Polyangiaceae bacterium]
AEKTLIRMIRGTLNLVPGRLVHFDGKEAAQFAKKLQEFQKTAESTFSKEVMHQGDLEPQLELSEEKFALTFATGDQNAREADVDAVFSAWRDGLDVVPLKDGGWAPLPTDWLNKYGSKVAMLMAARTADEKIPPHAAGPLAALCEELGEPVPASFEKLRPIFENFEELPEAKLPETLDVELRPYQESGVNWLSFLSSSGLGAILADDMGLGKTLQTICVINGATLVVCPKSVVFNWEREVKRFRNDLSINIYHGPKRKLKKADVTLTTYSVLRLDLEKLLKKQWKMVVLDEAQAIKNPDSQAARAAFEISESLNEQGFRLALSGTPIENRLDELWSVFRFTHPGLLGSRPEFASTFSEPIAKGDQDVTNRLRGLIKPFLLRRMKRDVAKDLPPRTDSVLTIELEPDERELYDAIYAAKQKEVIESLQEGGTVMAALEALLRLRQVSCHAGLLPGHSRATSSKVETLLEELDMAIADGHKSIVFSQWTGLLDLVEPALKARGITNLWLDGKTSNRGAVVTKFQADDGPPVLLSSLKAGGTGLNLTAADHVFLLDPWWNPAAEDQAADRAHRIGQTRPVTVYRMIAKDTIEEGILELQGRKRALAEAALDGGGAAGGITRDDLLSLLGAR